MRAERRNEEKEWLILFKWPMREERCWIVSLLLPFQICKTSTALTKIANDKWLKKILILAHNIPGFQPAKGLLNCFMAVNRHRRCFSSRQPRAEVCVYIRLWDVQSSAPQRTQRRAVNCETCCSHDAAYPQTSFSPSAGTYNAQRPNAYSICNDLSPLQPAAFINWDKPSDNWNLSRAVWGNRSQKCHLATEKK